MSRRFIDPEVVAGVARRFGVEPDGLAFVRDVANVVYASSDGTRFLRFTHRDTHTESHVRAELEWLSFLVDEGLPVCHPIPADEGASILRVDETYTAACFERVPGIEVSLEEYREPILELTGRFLGRLHAASARFEPRDPECKRPEWDELEGLEPVLASWAPDDRIVIDAWREVFARVDAEEIHRERFGLIHGDVHRGNIFLHEGGIQVFDFDDSCTFFLAADVANSLYYSLWHRRFDPEPERRRMARGFLEALLRGYRSERAFEAEDVALIPDLLEFRELTVDAFSHRRRPDPPDDIRERYRHVRDRLARGAPYVEL